MNTSMIRGATLALSAAAGAALAVAFLPGGVAAADSTFWTPDLSTLENYTTTTGSGFVTTTGTEDWLGFHNGFGVSDLTDQAVTGHESDFAIPSLGYQNDSITITGDVDPAPSHLPVGTQIDLSGFGFADTPVYGSQVVDPTGGFGSEIISIPGTGLLGLPEVTDTVFTPWGDFTF
ncbi:MAG TPA: hypothetical protein VF299_09815 [Mycobacterium sp.]